MIEVGDVVNNKREGGSKSGSVTVEVEVDVIATVVASVAAASALLLAAEMQGRRVNEKRVCGLEIVKGEIRPEWVARRRDDELRY